jgi:isopentenyl diphosphate isomerase/L-lactate dehydrogenase-like FMN-dependent dehydrogenase
MSLSDYQSQIDSTFNWQSVEWMKTITKLPLILKGI